MSRLIDQYPDVRDFLRENLRDSALYHLEHGGDGSMAAWLADLEANGHIEIPAHMSVTGKPEIYQR